MLEIIALLIGIAIGVAIQRYWSRRSRPQHAMPAAAPLPTAPADVTAQPRADLTARLLPLRDALESFTESSAHPRELLDRPELEQAVALLADTQVSVEGVIDYALGANASLACAAFIALGQRADGAAAAPAIVTKLPQLEVWPLYFALQYLAALPQRLPAGAVVVHPDPYWSDTSMACAAFAAYFRRLAEQGDAATFGEALDRAGRVDVPTIEELLKAIDHSFSAALLAELHAWQARTVNRGWLAGIGRFWTREESELLIEHEALREPLLAAETAVTHVPARSLLIVGEPRSGKTAFAHLLSRRLASRGYAVFEAGAAEVMAGQKYIGELEERLRRLVAELTADKRVLWYIPEFVQIVTSGRHSGQAASILDQILPSIASGRLVVIGECTPGVLVKMQQVRPALRNALDLIRLRASSAQETTAIANAFVQRLAPVAGLTMDAAVVPAAMQLAAQYLGGQQLPGAVLDLLKAAANRAAAREELLLDRERVLEALSQATGLPRALLDDRERTDLGRVREFFCSRVIGQEEAVGAVVERIAMLKAGLTDPGRPVGVFLFAGPTGTGKTELAKTLAEYLFGTAERLIRLDMSEFQSPDSVRKIIGADDGETVSLIQRVRRQPFAVVLLDEFEKAHWSVWDLFLQVFDDGRLTDGLGQTADFRHTILILTSNLGATAHESAGVGFAPRADAFSQAQVMRAVGQSFRPEFVNRLDKVIVFRPLTRERMRGILQKELKKVLERRGLRNREWAVEWESSALEFLLDKGFSAAMGARPLKRAIDQHLLAPLAATMVEHRVPSGDQFLFVRSDGQAIQVEFVDPDAPEERPAEEGQRPGTRTTGTAALDARTAPRAQTGGASRAQSESGATLAGIILQPDGSRTERDALVQSAAGIEVALASAEWEQLHALLTARMAAQDFWDDPVRHRVLARYALMDRVRAAGRTAQSLMERYQRSARGAAGPFSRDLAARLALQLHLVRHGIQDVLTDAPIEVVVAVDPTLDGNSDEPGARAWCEQIVAMYCGWAGSRHMYLTRVQDRRSGLPLLVVSGFGAHAVLMNEAGLHVLETEAGTRSGGVASRVVARVRVAPSSQLASGDARGRVLLEQPASAFVVRRYRFEPSPLVRDARHGWRTGRVREVMAGNFDLLSESPVESGAVLRE